MKKRLLAFALSAAMLLALPGCAGEGNTAVKDTTPDSYAIAKASYPTQVQFPNLEEYKDHDAYYEDWQRWREANREHAANALDVQEIAPFLTASIPEFLTGTQGNEVYSPINVYMALAMLAELTDGNSRAQILSLLGEDSIEALRAQASALWSSVYRDDGAETSILASSLWLDEDLDYVQQTMDTLAKTYYASSYRGEMGSDAFNNALRGWLNEQTGGLLEEQAADVEMTTETILALASTVYFRAKWSDEFSPDRTTEGEFIILSPDGGTIPCKFMNSSRTGTYYWSDSFSAVARDLKNGGKMWFLLPDHANGVSTGALLDDPATMKFLLSNGAWEDQKQLVVNLSVPKFDVASETNMTGGMKRLGITDVFDPALSDFTPTITQMDGIVLSKADHASRVAIDEEGVTAAAYTMMAEAGAGKPPEEEVDFILDRPFLFAITTESGLPLFMGVVQRPV